MRHYPHSMAAAAILLLLMLPHPAFTQGRARRDPPGLETLRRESAGTARTSLHRGTGRVRFVRVEPGRLALAGPDPGARAADFLRRHGPLFGLLDPANELTAAQQGRDRLGGTHLRYRQVYRGLPVFGGEIRVHFDPHGRFTAANGVIVPDLFVDTRPIRSAAAAGAIALGQVEDRNDIDPDPALQLLGARLLIFRSGLLQGVPGVNHLAWEVEVGDGAAVRAFVYVDAHTGKPIDTFSGIETALDRRIHQPAFNNVVIWNEGDALPYSTGDPINDDQVNGLIDFAQDVYDFYSNLSGGSFLSWNGTDGTMHSVWDIPGSTPVPCPNAFWNGLATNYCNGVASDDVVAHEWTHAYTDNTHDLIYQWQSGALNESYSDIFGETVDLLNGAGTDTPGIPRTDGVCSQFTGPGPPDLEILFPPAITGPLGTGGADFNPDSDLTVTETIEWVDDGNDEAGAGSTTDGCQALVGFTSGRIALIDRGRCSFTIKVQNAQNAGAAAVLIASTGNSLFSMSGSSTTITIPAALITNADGNTIKAALPGVNATLTLAAASDLTWKWLVAEDSFSFGGAIRDMWDPTCLADPGKVSDTFYYHCGTGNSGGVHTNSGVPNHAFAMLVDGGSYNGRTIAPIGLTRAAHIYWRAMEVYQISVSDFVDHADSLEQSCSDLTGVNLTSLTTGLPSGISIGAADCTAVAEAMLAVEMRDEPTFCNFQPILQAGPPALDCGALLVDDDFESDPAGTWALSNSGVFAEYSPRDWAWTTEIPPGGAGSAFFGLDSRFIGNCVPGSNDQSGVMHLDSPAFTLTSGAPPLLSFDHYVATEIEWDGGNVNVSVNGAPFTLVDSPDFLFNPYNLVLRTVAQNNTNPLAGEISFSGSNGGDNIGSWGQSQVDLSPYATGGDTVQLRFSLGVDGCNGLDGWYIDNVRVCYDCAGVNGTDGDSDGVRPCDGDCDDSAAATFPGAAETNDGADNQCPGEPGNGLIDEISGISGFLNPADPTEYSWPAQAGASQYQVARAETADFTVNCATFNRPTNSMTDTDTAPGGLFFYLVRPRTPNTGSWGIRSSGLERTVPCAP